MIKFILLFMLFYNHFSFAQRKVKLLLIDSLMLHCKQTRIFTSAVSEIDIQYFNNCFYILDYESSTLHQFNKDGICINHFFVAANREKTKTQLLSFQVTNNNYYFSRFNSFVTYSDKGDFVKSVFLNYGEKGIYNQRLYSSPLMFVYESKQKIIIPIKGYENTGSFWENMTNTFYYEAYKNFGLLAVYPLTNQTKDTSKTINHSYFIGQRDPVYSGKKFLPHLDEFNWFADTTENRIYISEQATPVIYVYNITGKLINKFGEKGKHLTNKDSITTIFTFDNDANNQATLVKHKILSPTYEHIYYDKYRKLTFRLYRASIQEPMIKEMRNKYNYSLTKLFFLKPLFLQVYDNTKKDTLILDIPMPNSFHIITIEGNTMWVNSGFKENELHTLMIYKYNIEIQ